jgi:hypothetical protein
MLTALMDQTTSFPSAAGYLYADGVPDGCPPVDAKPVNMLIYRGIKVSPISERDFKSHREMNATCTLDECQCWGLSVWTSPEAVAHARKTQRFFRKWHIAAGTVDFSDGVLKATPSEPQPEHHTYWKQKDCNLSSKFQVVMPPESGSRK